MKANYCIVEDDFLDEDPLVIKDVGPWDKYATVTNAAESVVAELRAEGKLPDGRRLFYFDSEGEKAELLVRDGRFVGLRAVAE